MTFTHFIAWQNIRDKSCFHEFAVMHSQSMNNDMGEADIGGLVEIEIQSNAKKANLRPKLIDRHSRFKYITIHHLKSIYIPIILPINFK